MAVTLENLIADGRVHVTDGAMGTMLYDRGVFVNVCYDTLALDAPETVRDVHHRYVVAGAEVIETNTFGANPVKLSSYGRDGQTEEVNRAAAAVARDVAGDQVSVVGAMGPLGIRMEPFGPTARDEVVDFFRRQVTGLLDGGVDGFILETFSDLEELHAAFDAVRSLTDLPVIAQMTIGEDGHTAYGTDVETIARSVSEWGAEVVGINCSVGPAAIAEALQRMAEVTDRPLSAQPNAGLPRRIGDRQMYLASPEYIGQYARHLIEAGAQFVGGCCGTTPDHIREIRANVATLQQRTPTVRIPHPRIGQPSEGEAVPLAERSNWGRKLASGEFVTSVEILPPSGCRTENLFEQCRTLRDAGLDAVSLLDSPRGQTRMGALPTAILIEQEVGIETVMHYTCRDRHMLGMIKDLLGAAAGGLRNLLIVTGDPPPEGPYRSSATMFDIDSIGLTNVVTRLNHGLDPGGNSIGHPTEYVIGVAANQGAVDLEKELERFYWKVDAGAEFAVTQPVFDPAQLEAFLERIQHIRIPVVAGIWPLLSVRDAEFLGNEVPGISVPDSVMQRMVEAEKGGPEAAFAEGVAIAGEIFRAVRDSVQGVVTSTPHGNLDVVLEFLNRNSVAQQT